MFYRPFKKYQKKLFIYFKITVYYEFALFWNNTNQHWLITLILSVSNFRIFNVDRIRRGSCPLELRCHVFVASSSWRSSTQESNTSLK